MGLIRNIYQWQENNILHGKHDGKLGRGIRINKGVSPGIPISASIYIIFDDGIVRQYTQEMITRATGRLHMEIKYLNTEILSPNHLVNKHKKGSIEEQKEIYTPAPTQVNNINADQIKFSGDRGIAS